MHPFFLNRRWLAVYIAVWACLSAIPTALFGSSLPVVLVALPLSLVFGLVTTPVWYLCRAIPLRLALMTRLGVAHGVAGIFWSVVWVVLGEMMARFAGVFGVPGMPSVVTQQRQQLFAVGILFYLLIAALHYLMLGLQQARAAQQRETELALEAREAQLHALSAQVHPHFLFNCLNAISALVHRDPGRARAMCVHLADFLRHSLRLGERRAAPLHEELALVRLYLEVETIRFGARLRVDETVDADSRACVVPTLLLQPLVENAITHGIATLEQGGTVTLRAHCVGARLHVTISNPFDPEARSRRAPSGLGLANVRRRLHAYYGSAASLQVDHTADAFRVAIGLPWTTEEI